MLGYDLGKSIADGRGETETLDLRTKSVQSRHEWPKIAKGVCKVTGIIRETRDLKTKAVQSRHEWPKIAKGVLQSYRNTQGNAGFKDKGSAKLPRMAKDSQGYGNSLPPASVFVSYDPICKQ